MSRIFISYRRSDSAYVSDAIYKSLVSHFGRDHVFKDVDNIPPGVNFKKYLTEKVTQCEVLVAVMGAQWLQATDDSGRRLENPTDFVRIELEAALKREVPIIPVFVDNSSMPRPDQLPKAIVDLSYHQGVHLRPAPDIDRDMENLIKAVALNIPERTEQPVPVSSPTPKVTYPPISSDSSLSLTGDVTVRDNVIWLSHIKRSEELRQRLLALQSNQEITLRINGVANTWIKMRDGKDGSSTTGIRPLSEANEQWKAIVESSRGQQIEIELVSIQPVPIKPTGPKAPASPSVITAPTSETEEVQVWRLTAHWECPAQAVEIYKQEGYIAAGWGLVSDLRELRPQGPEDIARAIKRAYPSIRNISSGRRALWGLYRQMKPGDLVILSAEGRRVHVMQVTGDYCYNPDVAPILGDFQHQRPAVSTSIDPNELWKQAGAGFAPTWSPRWTLGLCANSVKV